MLTHGLKNTRGETVCHIPLETPKQPSHTLEVKIQGDMQIRRFGYRIRGFKKLVRYAINVGVMTEKAKQRAQVLTFWAKHGSEATKEAFKNKTESKKVQYVVAQDTGLRSRAFLH